jgi:hypothetical protein
MSTSDKVEPQKGPQAEPKKKRPYEPPKLERLGTLEEITKAVGNMGATDGGTKNNKRTSF